MEKKDVASAEEGKNETESLLAFHGFPHSGGDHLFKSRVRSGEEGRIPASRRLQGRMEGFQREEVQPVPLYLGRRGKGWTGSRDAAGALCQPGSIGGLDVEPWPRDVGTDAG